MQNNYLPAGAAVGVVESKVSPVTLYTKQSSAQALTNAALSDITCKMK